MKVYVNIKMGHNMTQPKLWKWFLFHFLWGLGLFLLDKARFCPKPRATAPAACLNVGLGNADPGLKIGLGMADDVPDPVRNKNNIRD